MKRKYTLPIFMFLIVVAISFIVFLNKAFSVGTTIYHDWSAIEKIDENYSYSTLFRSSNTIIKEMKKAGAYNSEYSSSLFNRDNIKPGDELIVLITNCATNKNGELLDVVVKINNVKKFSNASESYVTFQIGSPYQIATKQNDPETYKTYTQKVNEPLVFAFDTYYAQADFTMTYYKAGTYKSESNKGELGNISSVSGIYWDFDIENEDSDYNNELFNGYEGMVPKVGTSDIYYNKNKRHGSYSHTLKEQSNGIAISERNSGNTNTIYYESSAFMTTKDFNNSTFTFTYSGTRCGIYYMFASPYPYTIDKPTKSVNKESATTGEKFTYTVSQYIPNNYYGTLFSFNEIYSNLYKTSRFNSVVIKDTIDSHLTIDKNNIKVINETSTDVTSYFTIGVSGNTVTATATSTMLNNVDFYAHTYKLQIPVTVKSDTYGVDKIQNKATTTSSICKTDSNCPTENKDTNEVDVKIKYKLNVNYYEEGKPGSKVATSDSETYYYNDSYSTNYNKVDLKVWEFVRSDGDATSGKITKDTTVNYYFERRPYTLTVNYLEEGTNKPIDNMPADVTNPLYYDDPYSTNYSNVNQLKWKIVRSEVQKGEGTIAGDKTISGKIKENTVVNYYFEKIPYGLTVNYLEEGTKNKIADPDVTKPIYYDDEYKTNHDKIEHRMWRIVRSEVAEGEGEVVDETNKIIEGTIVGNTVVNYYFEKIEYPVTVNYYDAQTNEKIDESDKTIYYYTMHYYTNYDKIDRDIWEYVSNDGDPVEGEIDGEQESYTINYYFNRLKYRLLVNYYDDKTKAKIAKGDRYTYNYKDEYLTNYDKIDEDYWEYVRTEGTTPGIIYEDTEVDYYFKNNEYTLEVNYYDEETGEKIEESEVTSHKYGDEYTTNDNKIDKKKWELVEEPANKEGTVDGDIEVNYYYKKREYKITVNYYEEGTENKIVESRESEAYYGEQYITDYNNVDEEVWKLVNMPENYQGIVNGDLIVNYYFRQAEIENPQTGPSQNVIIIEIVTMISMILIVIIAVYKIYLKRKIYKL